MEKKPLSSYYQKSSFIALGIIGVTICLIYGGIGLLWSGLTMVLMFGYNYIALGLRTLAIKVFVLGTLFCIGCYGLLFFIPHYMLDKVGTVIIPACLLGPLLFDYYQKPLFNKMILQFKPFGILGCLGILLFYPLCFFLIALVLVEIGVIVIPVEKRIASETSSTNCAATFNDKPRTNDAQYISDFRTYISCVKKLNTPHALKFASCGEMYINSFKLDNNGYLINKEEVKKAMKDCELQ